MRYYISDLHYFHKNIVMRLENRGFASLEDMHNYMIKQWNSKVTEKDDVYILGDFSFGSVEQTEGILKKLKGRKHLITGNHDHYISKESFDKSLFASIEPYHEIRENGRTVILCHYPIMCYNRQYSENTWMLHGHVHNTKDQTLIDLYHRCMQETQFENLPEFNLINTYCVFSDYVPLSLEEWITTEKERYDRVWRSKELHPIARYYWKNMLDTH